MLQVNIVHFEEDAVEPGENGRDGLRVAALAPTLFEGVGSAARALVPRTSCWVQRCQRGGLLGAVGCSL